MASTRATVSGRVLKLDRSVTLQACGLKKMDTVVLGSSQLLGGTTELKLLELDNTMMSDSKMIELSKRNLIIEYDVVNAVEESFHPEKTNDADSVMIPYREELKRKISPMDTKRELDVPESAVLSYFIDKYNIDKNQQSLIEALMLQTDRKALACEQPVHLNDHGYKAYCSQP